MAAELGPGMADRVAIFAGVLRRNALRSESHLPLLDVRTTYRQEVASRRASAVHDAFYPTLRAKVIARLASERGSDFLRTRLAAWMVHTEVSRLLRDLSCPQRDRTTTP